MIDHVDDLPKPAWGWLAALGVLLIVMGVFAIAAPLIASLAVGAWIGILFVIAGIGQVAHAVTVKGWGPSVGHMAVGAVYAIGGLLVIFQPLAGLMAFTLLICAMLLAAGVTRLISAFQMRPKAGWGWLATAGAIALIAGAAVFASFPGSSLWLLGLLAGVSFLSEGWALLTLGLLLRRDG